MPVPIRPIDSRGKDGKNRGVFDEMALLSLLSNIPSSGASAIVKTADLADDVAGTLLELWEQSDKIGDGREYAVPEDFPRDKVMQLKVANLLTGDEKVIKFTQKAENAIKFMVLAEENKLGKDATKKPYSVIMAEAKAPKRKSNLTFVSASASKGVVTSSNTGIVVSAPSKVGATVTADVRNSELPDGFDILENTPYIYSQRLVFQEGSSNKHYFVRIYKFLTTDGDQYAVVAYNGRIGGSLVKQEKGLYHNRVVADGIAAELIRSKERKGYVSARDTDEPPGREVAPNAPGQRVTQGTTRRSRPEPAPAPAEPSPEDAMRREEARRIAREDRRRSVQVEQELLRREEEERKAAAEAAENKKRAKELKDAIQKALSNEEENNPDEEFIPEDEIN